MRRVIREQLGVNQPSEFVRLLHAPSAFVGDGQELFGDILVSERLRDGPAGGGVIPSQPAVPRFFDARRLSTDFAGTTGSCLTEEALLSCPGNPAPECGAGDPETLSDVLGRWLTSEVGDPIADGYEVQQLVAGSAPPGRKGRCLGPTAPVPREPLEGVFDRRPNGPAAAVVGDRPASGHDGEVPRGGGGEGGGAGGAAVGRDAHIARFGPR